MAAGYGLWTVAMARGGAEHLAPLGYTTPLPSTLLLLATGAPATATTLIGVGLGLVLACGLGGLGVLANRGPEAPSARRPQASRQPTSRGIQVDAGGLAEEERASVLARSRTGILDWGDLSPLPSLS